MSGDFLFPVSSASYLNMFLSSCSLVAPNLQGERVPPCHVSTCWKGALNSLHSDKALQWKARVVLVTVSIPRSQGGCDLRLGL